MASFLSPRLKDMLPDPFHLKDMEKCVDHIGEAIENDEPVAVFGDYDVDGATASSLLKRYFNALKKPLRVYIPDRITEGYGPNEKAMETLAREGIKHVIFVDCGTTSFAPLIHAKTLGLNCIIIDHHASEERYPPCVGLINPNRCDEISPYTYLCAAGVVYLFLIALQKKLRDKNFFERNHRSPLNLLTLLDTVALGTVCDVVPLVGLNRCFVIQGLKVMNHSQNKGLQALMKIAGVHGAIKAYHLGFVLGPRINAGGRVGACTLGTQLLSSDDWDEALSIAKQLDALNQERRDIEEIAYHEALEQVSAFSSLPTIICLGHERWHPGVIGIVAGRLKEAYSRPTCIIAWDEEGLGKGSGRSVSGIHLGYLMHKAKEAHLLMGGGGHAMAAGFSLKKENMEAFSAFLEKSVETDMLIKALDIKADMVLEDFSSVDFSMMEDIEALEPFGMSHPSPRFILKNMRLQSINIVKEQHLRIHVMDQKNNALQIMHFRSAHTPLGQALQSLLLQKNTTLHLFGSIKRHEWNGHTSCQFTLEDAMEMV
jgi:single-stranded-DNA-specific exonuclease